MKAFFLHSSIWVAICASCLTASTYLIAEMPVNVPYVFFCFFAGYFTYTLDRFLTSYSPEDRLNRPETLNWQKKHSRFILITLYASFVFSSLLLISLEKESILFLSIFGAFSFLYVLPVLALLPGNTLSKLKDLGPLKPVLLATIWTGGTVFIPLMERKIQLTTLDYSILVDRFLLLLLNGILFDFLDFQGDRQCGKKTIPVLLGREKTVTIVHILAWGRIISSIINKNGPAEIGILYTAPYFFISLFSFYAERFTAHDRLKKISGHILDGILLTPLLLYLLFG